jgi:hypothetical protein
MVCLFYGLFGFVFVFFFVFRSVLGIVLYIHKFIFPAFRFLFTRPIPLSTFKRCKDHFSFWDVDFERKL